MYRALDAVLLRAAAQPAEINVSTWPDPTADRTGEAGRAWLSQIWSRPSLVEAITLASPDLADQIARLYSRHRDDHARQVRRAVLAVTRYLLRATGRATPFGTFAGITAGALGGEPQVRWGRAHHPVVRADAGWLTAVVTELELCRPLLRRLPVLVNELCVVRGDRLLLPYQQESDGPSLTEVSVRYTPAVAAVVRYARAPIGLAELEDKLTADFPATRPAVIEDLLAGLVRSRMLLTGLRPPMTATDGLGHMLAVLDAADAGSIAEITDRVRALCAVHTGLRQHNHTVEPFHRSALSTTEMAAVNDTAARPLTMVDLRLDAQVTLPDTLARHAEAAATALTRLAPYQDGLPAWREYHAAFLDRYGIGAVVPVRELTDPGTGLGLPATYRGSQRRTTVPPPSDRDRRLLALAYDTALAGGTDLVLDERTLTVIAGEQATTGRVPAHVELFLQVHAADIGALRRDEYDLWVTGAARSAGATTGRFLDLLDPHDRDRFRNAYTGLPTARLGALPAQVSGPPLRTRLGNLARTPVVAPAVIPVAEFPDPGAVGIRLDDLAVGADADGMYLVWLSEQRLVEPAAFNAVEFRHHAHPLARFLSEISRARATIYQPFSWGTADHLPVLPRVRYGRTALCPARWNLSATDLPGPDAPWPRWRDGLAAWRRRYRMPDTVHLVEADNLLPLDLNQPLHLTILRAHLDRTGHARLDETPPPGAYGWLDGHAHEIVVPLACTDPPVPGPRLDGVRPVRRDHGHLPGASRVLYAKLYAPPDRHTDLLARLPELFTGWDVPTLWWYLPYHDPEPHLRLRIRLPADHDYGPATHRLGAWAARQRDHRLLGEVRLDTYHPETGRYGHGPAMAAAERLFAADSLAALAQLSAAGPGAPLEAITAASLVHLTLGLAGDTSTGMRWLTDHLPHDPVPVPRHLHTAATRLADPHDGWAALRAVDGGEQILHTWRDRHTALAGYRRHLADRRDPYHVLPSLLHLHHIRTMGIDPDRERTGRRLARAAALRWIALSTATGQRP